jgi:hypothetical protein
MQKIKTDWQICKSSIDKINSQFPKIWFFLKIN